MKYFLLVIALSFTLVTVQSEEKDEETECQRHKREMERSTAPVRWNITCDENGDYAPKQCTYDTPRWCQCYRKDGQTLTQPSRKITSCNCVVERDEKVRNGTEPCDVPECEDNGTYEKKQCCESTRQCRCVDEETGEPKTEPSSDDVTCE